MNRRQESTLYATVAASILSAGMLCAVAGRSDGECCAKVMSGQVEWMVGPASGGFDGLVWAKTETGVQLRSKNDIATGDQWTPLVAPQGKSFCVDDYILISRNRGAK